MRMKKRGVAGIIAVVLLVIIAVFSVVILYTSSVKILKSGVEQSDKKIEAISYIDLKIVEVYFFGENLVIVVKNSGQKDVTSFVVKVTSSENKIYFNNSVYLENNEKLGPLNSEDIIIIPAPFGNYSENYSLVEVYPKFEYNGEEVIAETARTSVAGSKIGGGGGGNVIPPEAQTDCDYFASPEGFGNGTSINSPFNISNFWSLAKPGDTLCLLDGVYQDAINNARAISMINPPEGLNGTRENPITIKSINEGNVFINGKGKRIPILLRRNKWIVIQGVNAFNSSSSVVSLSYSNNNVIRRVVAWDSYDGNNEIFGIHYNDSYNNLFEDCAGFGVARKTYQFSYGGHNTTCRRCFGLWEGLKNWGSPYMVFAPVYNNYNALLENCIGTVDIKSMLDIANGLFIFSSDREDGDKRANLRILGSIAYTKPSQNTSALHAGFFFTKLSHIYLINSAAFMSNNKSYPFRFHALGVWIANRFYSITGSNLGANTAVMPVQDNGHFYDCINSTGNGRSSFTQPIWPVDGGTVRDGNVTWKDFGNLILNGENLTSIGNASEFVNRVITKNILSSKSVSDAYGLNENLFNSNNGARICYKYKDGVLSNEPLWPWPMEKRIWDAMTYAGYGNINGADKRINVTRDIIDIFGEIPAECRVH